MEIEHDFRPLICLGCEAALIENRRDCPACGACRICWQPAGRHSASIHWLALRRQRQP
jgi:hypothetical protein